MYTYNAMMVSMNEGLDSLQDQIKKLTALVEENHAMLISIQRRARMTILISSIKWLVILGITFGSFIFLQPYLDTMFSAYSSLSELTNPFPKNANATSTTNSTDDNNQAEGLINAIRAYMPR
jgi:hypothetical protein